MAPLKILARLQKYVWTKDQVWPLLGAFLLTVLMIILNAGVLLLFKYVISLLSQQPAPLFLTFILIAYGITWTLNQAITQARPYALSTLLEESANRVSLALFSHLHALSLRFHLSRHTGSISTALNRAHHGIEALFWGLLIFLIPTTLEVLLALGIIWYLYGILYGVLVLLFLGLYIIGNIVSLSWSQRAHEMYNEKRSFAHAFMIDSLLNFETVKYFGGQKFEYSFYKKALDAQKAAAQKVNMLSSLSRLVQALIIGAGLTILTYFTGHAVLNKTMAISDFVLINAYVLQFVMPLSYIGYILQQIRKGFVDLSTAIELLETKPEIVDSPNAITLPPSPATIAFNHVSFSYEPQREILHDISFTVPAGHTVALVGPTGSGKSTIARLLFRLYDVTSGSITIHGHDIRTITQESLHALMGVVPQDTVLFNNTLFYNIAYGNPHATKDDVEKAAHLAHLEKFIHSLPEGYQTRVGERGLKISGGEKQRIAIARTIIKNPVIYIFDEATSALDTHTEKEIQQNIKEISKNATTLIIAHRLSTIIDADEILVFDAGQIVERGNHHQLLAHHGLYSRLWQQQAQN